jgi:catechol 2,3-dioxygenase-like lactoylglutathione lyase family enzyme
MFDHRWLHAQGQATRWLAYALLLNACATTPSATVVANPAPAEVRSIALTVADLSEAERFFTQTLGFVPEGPHAELSGPELSGLIGVPGARALRARLSLGNEHIELVQYPAVAGRAAPPDSRSNDAWFQHLALVTSDIDALEQRVQDGGASAISSGTQTIPQTNPAAGGIRAFYFRGPSAHPLELIWYPSGKGMSRWQQRSAPLLGIDHTAIAVADSARSQAFYADLLGLTEAGHSLNSGREQSALSGVDGAEVRITGLRGPRGPGVELLEYAAPRGARPMPADSRATDLWYAEITIAVPNLDATVAQLRAAGAPFLSDRIQNVRELVPGAHRAVLVRDPDGHAVRLVD